MAKEKTNTSREITGKESFNKKRVIIGIVVIVAAVLLAVAIIPMLSRSVVTYRVLAAKQPIPKGTMITKDNMDKYLKIVNTTDKSVADTGYSSADALFTLYFKTDLYQDQIVTKTAMTNTSVISSDRVPDGKELVGMRVMSVESSVGYMPKSGDIIRVYGLKSEEIVKTNIYGELTTKVENNAFVYDLLRYIEIYDVLDSNGKKVTESGNNPTNFVMIMSTQQAEQMIEAQSAGSMYLSLISSGDAEEKERLLSIQEQYVEAYSSIYNLGSEPIHTDSTTVALSGFRISEYYPMPGDIVKISYVSKTEKQQMNDKGEISTVTATELLDAETMPYLEVKDIADKNHKSIRLGVAGSTDTVTDYKAGYKNYYITFDLTAEQQEELASLIKSGNVYITYITNSADPELENYKQAAENAARVARIHKLLDGIEN